MSIRCSKKNRTLRGGPSYSSQMRRFASFAGARTSSARLTRCCSSVRSFVTERLTWRSRPEFVTRRGTREIEPGKARKQPVSEALTKMVRISLIPPADPVGECALLRIRVLGPDGASVVNEITLRADEVSTDPERSDFQLFAYHVGEEPRKAEYLKQFPVTPAQKWDIFAQRRDASNRASIEQALQDDFDAWRGRQRVVEPPLDGSQKPPPPTTAAPRVAADRGGEVSCGACAPSSF